MVKHRAYLINLPVYEDTGRVELIRDWDPVVWVEDLQQHTDDLYIDAEGRLYATAPDGDTIDE